MGFALPYWVNWTAFNTTGVGGGGGVHCLIFCQGKLPDECTGISLMSGRNLGCAVSVCCYLIWAYKGALLSGPDFELPALVSNNQTSKPYLGARWAYKLSILGKKIARSIFH